MSDTKPDLDAIEARAKTATSPVWHAWDRSIGWEVHVGAEHIERDLEAGIFCTDLNSEFRETFTAEDAAHIAGMDPATTLNLVAYARTLEAEVERLSRVDLEPSRQMLVDDAESEAQFHSDRAEAAKAERDQFAQRLDQVRELAQPFSDASTGIVERVTGMHDLTRAAAHAVVSEVLRDVRRVLDGDQRTGEA